MGMDLNYFTTLVKTIKPILSNNIKVLCLGYPDLLVTKDELENLLPDLAQDIPKDRCEKEIQTWHKRTHEIYDPMYIFKRWNFDVTIFDAVAHRGIETIVNLNENIDVKYHNQYNLIIDTGTLEHCFNVGTAFKNMCNCCAKDGYIFTAAPLTKINHGYYNFCPILYRDGFSFNGFEIVEQNYIRRGEIVSSESILKNKLLQTKVVNQVIAKKVSIKDWTWPIQGKYI